MPSRSEEEIKMRCRAIFDKPDIICIVEKSSSPTAAFDMVKDATKNDEIARAARWLAVMRRDYLHFYKELIHNPLSHAK